MRRFYPTMMAILSVVVAGATAAKASRPFTVPEVSALRHFLRAYVRRYGGEDIKTIRFAVAALPTTDSLLVYLQDQRFCGTSGCGILIVKPIGRSFREVDDIGGCWPPFTMLPRRHKGMPDIGIWIQGGGVLPGYQTSVSFNGKRYAYTQGFPPKHRIARASGKVLIPDEIPRLSLYP